MALTQRLQLRQSHALVMTPQLMQAIKLLQLSNLDLWAYVETELERNPLLERAADGESIGQSNPEAAPAAENGTTARTELSEKEERPAPDLDDGAAVDTDAAASRANTEASERSPGWAPAGIIA